MSVPIDPSQPNPGSSVAYHEDAERTEIRQQSVFSPESPAIHATSPAESAAELVGQNLDHYRIESLVGIGGMGAVFRGRDLRLDRVVAIKVVPMAHRRADAMRRFRMEAQSAAKLDHPNIARVHYVGETDRWSYIVFEFIEGTNLRQLVLERGILSVDDATHYACQVAEALQHAHERGVVHRDIKPSNILIGKDGKAKIVDMGLARTTELDRSTGDLTASGVTLGTFDYISPEQAHDPRDADVRSDIYSLGCTTYFLLTGQPPFPDGTALQKLLMHGTKMPEDPRCFRSDLSDALIAILRKMMAKKPRDRYQEPIDLVNDLRTLATVDSLAWRDSIQEEQNAHLTSQRSWWESSLPTLLCTLAIAMVTLWLYNANQLRAVYVIPRIEIAELQPDDGATTSALQAEVAREPAGNSTRTSEPSPPTNPPLATVSKPSGTATSGATSGAASSAAIRPVVVKALVVLGDSPLPIELARDSFEGVRTLDDAIVRWNASETIESVVLAVPSVSITRPMDWIRSKNRTVLRIASAPNMRCRISIDEPALRSVPSSAKGWLNLDGLQCSIESVDIEWQSTLADGYPSACVSIQAGARLSVTDTTVSVQSDASKRLPTWVRFQGPTTVVATTIATTATAALPTAASGLDMDRCSLRGQCDVVQIESNDRIDVRLQDCWTAVSGSMFDVEGAKTINRSPGFRSELNHVTSITLSPWTRIRMGNVNPYPVAFVRLANESLFSGASTLVEWDASNVSDWNFTAQAKRVDDLGRWIDLRGLDNLYDVPSIAKLVQVIMSMSSEEVSIDSDSNLLRNERGMELLAAWQSAPRLETASMHTQTPRPSQWLHSGLQPGCRIDLLPPFPISTVAAKAASADERL